MDGIILTEIDLNGYDFGDVKVEKINNKVIDIITVSPKIHQIQ